MTHQLKLGTVLALSAFFCGMSMDSLRAADVGAGIPGVPIPPVSPVDPSQFQSDVSTNLTPPRGLEFDSATFSQLSQAPVPGPVAGGPSFQTPVSPSTGITANAAPPLGTNFQSIADTGFIPADPILAVGTQSIIEVVNSSLRITNRTGGSASTTSLQSMLGIPSGAKSVAPAGQLSQADDNDDGDGDIEAGGILYDPWIHYDHFAGRFVLICICNNSSSTAGWYVVAVSRTATPTTSSSSWYVYYLQNNIDFPSKVTPFWGDYEKLGFDNTYFYITSNQFNSSGTFQYAKIRRYTKSQFYSGKAVSGVEWTDVRDSSNNRVFTILPAVTFGTPGVEYLASCTSGSGNTINTFWISGTTSPLLYKSKVAVQSWSVPNGARQKGSSRTIDSGDARLLGAVYRNSRLYVCHTVKTPSFSCAAHYVGINTSSMAKTLDTVIGHSLFDYYYPALTVSSDGNLGTVVSFSSAGGTGVSARYAGIAYTQVGYNGAIGAPLNVLKEGENSYYKTYSATRNRWGDYNGMALDPSNGRSIWFNAMYAKSSVNTWGTWIGNCLLSASPGSPAVQASFDANTGLLTIAGDDAPNNIQIDRIGKLVTVRGLSGTRINGQLAYSFVSSCAVSLEANMNGGSDVVKLIGVELQDANVALGDGDDQLSILLSSISDLSADGGDGIDSLVTTSSDITTTQEVNIP